MKKILLFSRDPGGANTVIPLVGALNGRGYEVRLFGKDIALERYSMAGLEGKDIIGFVKNINQDAIEDLLLSENPDFIITGTSACDFTEKYLWKASEKLNIPSFAILDQWINYGIRFSRYSTAEIGEYEKDKSLPYLPSRILVMDEYAREEAIKDGLDPSKILVSGQPYFETLLKEKEKASSEMLKELRSRLGIGSDDLIITFASEPVSKDYKNDYWGFNEKTIFEQLFEGVKEVSKRSGKKISMIIKVHPREDEGCFEGIASETEKLKIIIDRDSKPMYLILISDIVAGMSSMFLIEAAIIGKPVLSLLMGMNNKRESPFVLDRKGIVKSIKGRKELINRLDAIIASGGKENAGFDFIRNPVINIISYMEKYLCQN